ncbi:MAG: thioredoxin family protein [Methylococcales bacterium]|nr:thioredoxin family protein [Methylococcales bacterium]
MAVLELTKANFKDTIEKNAFVIVDFWAPWCTPCVSFTPIFEEAAAANPDIVFGMVNTETDNEIAEYFQVEKIPGIMVVRDQASILAQVGELGAPALAEIITWARQYDMSTVHRYYADQDTLAKAK